MVDAFGHFNGLRYQLGSFAVAWNHVHVLVAPLPGIDISSVLHSWKSFTASAINKVVGRKGPLWMDESYDQLIRGMSHLGNVERYIAAHERQGAYVEQRPIGLEG